MEGYKVIFSHAPLQPLSAAQFPHFKGKPMAVMHDGCCVFLNLFLYTLKF